MRIKKFNIVFINNMKIKTLIKIGIKTIFWFLTICFILFFNVKEVNLVIKNNNIMPIFSVKKIKQIKYNAQIKQNWNKKKNKKNTISQKSKRIFLLKLVISAFKKKHFSAIDKNTYKKLCNYYKWRCSIIEVDEFSYQKKTYYTALTIYLVIFVNKYLPSLKETLEYIKIQPEKKWRRWYAWHHSIILNVKKSMDYKQFFEVLTHELWHIVDLWILNWTSIFKSKKFTEFWKKAFAKDDPSLQFYKLCWLSENVKKADSFISDFVSWYWMTDTFEDFAESFNMYINHNRVFRQMASESNILKYKYNFIAKLFKWHYINDDKKFLYKSHFRPWDSTRFNN